MAVGLPEFGYTGEEVGWKACFVEPIGGEVLMWDIIYCIVGTMIMSFLDNFHMMMIIVLTTSHFIIHFHLSRLTFINFTPLIPFLNWRLS